MLTIQRCPGVAQWHPSLNQVSSKDDMHFATCAAALATKATVRDCGSVDGGQDNAPCAVPMSCTPRCAMVRAATASASVPISSMTTTCRVENAFRPSFASGLVGLVAHNADLEACSECFE